VVSGQQRLRDGTVVPLDKARLSAPLEGALSALSMGIVVLAAALVLMRL
jgi:hypothetical protein